MLLFAAPCVPESRVEPLFSDIPSMLQHSPTCTPTPTTFPPSASSGAVTLTPKLRMKNAELPL